MQSGIITLLSLYEFVLQHPFSNEALRSGSDIGREFNNICKKITEEIPDSQGFYLWGNYDNRKLWKNIYLGKAGIGRTANLRSRILEELKDERCCFWRVVRTEDDLMNIGKLSYPKMWSKYKIHWKRSFLKAGASHIAWVATPGLDNTDIIRVESDLIEAMNPLANFKRPTPPSSLQKDTTKIFTEFRRNIHNSRKSRFDTTLFTSYAGKITT